MSGPTSGSMRVAHPQPCPVSRSSRSKETSGSSHRHSSLRPAPGPSPEFPPGLFDPTTLVTMENTHNEAGGTIWPLKDMQVRELKRRKNLGLAVHLDGARLWNAVDRHRRSHSTTYAATADTVNVCFSKGLGAPIGSVLAGQKVLIDRARRFKKMFGGGFRQAGIIAAGALYAVENNRDRLDEDHAHARQFAEAIDELPGLDVDLDSVQTNIVYFDVPEALSNLPLRSGQAESTHCLTGPIADTCGLPSRRIGG